MKLLAILFLLKLYAHMNIFRHKKEKYGQKVIKLATVVQRQRSLMTKTECNIKYLLLCKRNNLIAYFYFILILS